MQTCILHAQEHKGFMPPVGWTYGLGQTATPNGLFDDRMEKYLYFTDGGIQRPMGMAGSIAKMMDQNLDVSSRINLEAALAHGTSSKVLVCPSDRDTAWLGYTIAEPNSFGGSGWTGPKAQTSYAFNEGVLGISINNTGGTQDNNTRLRGKLSAVRLAAQVFLMTDSTNLRDGTYSTPGLLVYYNHVNGQTLLDVWNGNNCGDNVLFDKNKHQNRMNIVFIDGHAEAVLLEPGYLKNIYITAP